MTNGKHQEAWRQVAGERVLGPCDTLECLLLLTVKAYGDTLAEHEAAHVSMTYRNLAVQVLRYTRGAGDVQNLFNAIHQAADVSGKLEALSRASVENLLVDLQAWNDPRPSTGENAAIDMMCSGALQVVASRVSGDKRGDPEGKGRRELLDGISSFNDLRAEATTARSRR